MALRKRDNSASERAEEVFSQIKESADRERKKEHLRTISFQIWPSLYEDLQGIFDHLGLNKGAGLRYALKEFVRNHQNILIDKGGSLKQ